MERTTRFPNRRVVNNRRVQSHNILSFCDKMIPPNILQIFFQFGTQRTVIEKSGVSVVDLGRGKDDSSSFAQRNNFFHVGDILWFGCLLFFCSRGGSFFRGGRRQDTASSRRRTSSSSGSAATSGPSGRVTRAVLTCLSSGVRGGSLPPRHALM